MKSTSWILLLSCLIASLAACAAPLPHPDPVAAPPLPPQTTPPPTLPPPAAPVQEAKPGPAPPVPREEPKRDEELFILALRQLSDPLNADPGLARQALATLLTEHPQSKWQEGARTTLRLLNELDTYRQRLLLEYEQSLQVTAEKNNVAKELELLKKELRLLNEKYQTDLTAAQQENEQLKKDLQQLKNLEIQREKREKMLR